MMWRITGLILILIMGQQSWANAQQFHCPRILNWHNTIIDNHKQTMRIKDSFNHEFSGQFHTDHSSGTKVMTMSLSCDATKDVCYITCHYGHNLKESKSYQALQSQIHHKTWANCSIIGKVQRNNNLLTSDCTHYTCSVVCD